MANFPTHLLGAVTVGIVSSSILGAAGLLPLAGVASGIGLVALGGIFPDVDSDHSDAISLVFDTLSVAVAAPRDAAISERQSIIRSRLIDSIASSIDEWAKTGACSSHLK